MLLVYYIIREYQKLQKRRSRLKLAEIFNNIILHSQYSKIQLFCSMVQIFPATNQSHGMDKKISIVRRGFLP